jgi:hypothetical protein
VGVTCTGLPLPGRRIYYLSVCNSSETKACTDIIISAYQAIDEAKYVKDAKVDRVRQLQELHSKLDERSIEDIEQLQSFEDDIQFAKAAAISADDSRKAAFQLAFDEDQQIVAVSFKQVHFY